jgi:ribosomal protein S18 acetylase RimI-like enzyme
MTASKINIQELKTLNHKATQDITDLVNYLYKSKKITPDISKIWLRRIIKNPKSHFLIAFDNQAKKVVGMLTLISYPTIGGYLKFWIEDVVVSENYQNRGIGKKLLLSALKQAKKIGAKEVNLTSNPKRISANFLYQKLGFEKYETNVYRYYF